MNTPDTLQSNSRIREYLDLWAKIISENLGKLVHAKVTADTLAGEETSGRVRTEAQNGVWIRFAADQAVEQALFLTSQDALQLSRFLSGSPAAQEAGLNSVARKAVEGFFSQIAGKFPIADWLGFDAELKLIGSEPPEWESSFQTVFRFFTPHGSLLVLDARLSTELASALQSVQEIDKMDKEGHLATGSNPFLATSETMRDVRLELLMDVELDAVLRFGQREMLLRDVLNLTPGTVLELDQQVQDPVELLVGDKVIAWGEVVAVDGYYGLRITSLASRKERLESLRK